MTSSCLCMRPVLREEDCEQILHLTNVRRAMKHVSDVSDGIMEHDSPLRKI